MSPVVAAILPTERRARRDAGSVESITRRPPVIASDIGRNGMGSGAGVRRMVCDSSVMNWSASRSAGRVSSGAGNSPDGAGDSPDGAAFVDRTSGARRTIGGSIEPAVAAVGAWILRLEGWPALRPRPVARRSWRSGEEETDT